MKQLSAVVAGHLTLGSVASQAQERHEFEVASVKPYSVSQADASVTLGARVDGAQVRMVGLTMRDLLASAYRVKVYQIVAPDWVSTERYDINAKLPSGVSPEKLPEMTEARAKGIIGYRKSNGEFIQIDELELIPQVKPIYGKIKDLVTVE